ncbi:hypothetical protein OQA88_5962 [Cercophora sp. LCS_1]
MKIASILVGILPLAGLTVAAPEDVEAAATKRVAKLTKQYQKAIGDAIKHRKTGCTSKKLLRRKEWGTLSKKERLSCIDAIHCLASKPPLSPPSEIPGARSRYDDFVGSHVRRTDFVHNDGLFLGFHRNYVHLFEKALREECGYEGTQPYWDSSISYEDPRKSTVFDGSPWSLGGNGVYIPDRPPTVIPFQTVWGTVTSQNVPPSPNATLDSQINFGVISGPKKLGDLVSSVDGDFCYIYE